MPSLIHMANTYKKIPENRKYCLSRAEELINSELIRKAFFHMHQEVTLPKFAAT